MHKDKRLPKDGRFGLRVFRAGSLFTAFRSWVLALTLLLPGSAFATGFTCTQPATPDAPPPILGELAALDEVLIDGSQPTRRTRDLGAWLKRLEGQYNYEGHVDLCGNGHAADQRPVTGKADCAALYHYSDTEPPTSLYCVIDVRWPEERSENGVSMIGGASHLSPAVVVYGVVPDLPGIQFMQIDNKGVATHARGTLVGDTLTTKEPCGIRGLCQKVTQITARPDSKEIAMLIDVEIDSQRVLHHTFLLHRISNIQIRRNWYDVQLIGER